MRRTDNRRNVMEAEVSCTLEDELFLQTDKLLALCVAQSALDSGDCQLPRSIRSHYSLAMEEQARALRKTLERLLECGG